MADRGQVSITDTQREGEREVLFFMINFIEIRRSDMVDLGPELKFRTQIISPSPRLAHPRLVLNLKVVDGAGGVRNGDITARRNLYR